jgi:GDPmannose 4,6-dehydratase
MWLMLQQETPDDYVVATGNTYTIKEFLEVAFSRYDLDWEKHVVIDPKFYRPAEVEFLRGSPKKVKQKLGWSPDVSFYKLVERMVEHDVAEARLSRQSLQTV